MAESGNSSGSADSYIGSVISLISKSDIRYEGVLGGINTEDSTIQLNRVKSYGTEGRSKDGPQILPSDREFAYILFRGSDIKDLQVKSSPPVHTQEALYNDPAIIQSHYTHVPSSSTTSDPVSVRSVTGVNISGESSNFPGPVYHGATYSSYAGEGLGTYGCATQNVEGSSLAMPMYLNGSYGPHDSLPSGQQRPIPFQPPTGPGPSIFQSSEVQVSGSSNMGRLSEHRNVPHPVNRTDYLLPYDMPSGATPTVVSTSYPSDMPLPVMTSFSSNLTSMTSNLPTMTSVAPLNQNVNASVAPFSDNKFGVATASGLPIQPFASSILGSTSGPSLEISAPLLTPNQLIQPGLLAASPSTQTLYHEEKNTEVLGPLLSNPSYAVSSAPIQMPLLPLPYSQKQLNESVMGSRPTNGERREDRRQTFQNSTTQFTEEFDFIAMNEKFKKDEVWGYLGKAKQNNKTEGIVGNQNDQYEGHDGGYGKGSETNEKPVYVKDEFFDTLSSSSFGRGARNGGRRTDNDDLGNFQQRPYMSRGGRGFGRGGYYRGSNNHGSGYGYGMRGYMP